jgi:hypothetical protein
MSEAEELLKATRNLMREARGLMNGEIPRSPRLGVLGLYESLCRSLEGIDGQRVQALVVEIAKQIERLNQLAADVERIQRLRKTIRNG